MINKSDVWFLLLFFFLSGLALSQQLSIGSKIHPESRLLGEIMAQTIEQNTDLKVNRRFGLGGTLICFEALRTGEIDMYVEYTGTVQATILKEPYSGQDAQKLYDYIAKEIEKKYALIAGPPMGFSNSYVLITNQKLGLKKISDLQDRTDLKYGFSNEFVKRDDGFLGLNKYYKLQLPITRGMDHGLAYKALKEGQVDVTDAYSTDGRLMEYDFQLLDDDKHFFPDYSAFPLVRKNTIEKYPEVMEALNRLRNILTEEKMQALNYRYEINKESLDIVAFEFLSEEGIIVEKPSIIAIHPLIRQTIEHIQLTFIATIIAILIAVPLGIYITFKQKLASLILSATGIIQTIPSLALLGFMIPLFGIGFTPAVIALFLYALLPIVRNTHTGLLSTDPILIEAGKAMGMTQKQILFSVRLPLGMDMIMAGIRTALTINIGTATLAAFIGAGGLGESIITGITLNDNNMILRGAIPAALLALIADQGMALVEKAVRPKGIKREAD